METQVTQRNLAEHQAAHRGVDTVRADEQIGLDLGAGQPDADAVAVILDGGHRCAETEIDRRGQVLP